jgi:hypothetical protein
MKKIITLLSLIPILLLGASDISMNIMKELAVPVLPDFDNPNLAYSKEDITLMKERAKAAEAKINTLYAEALDLEFTVEELQRILDFIGSDEGKKFVRVLNFGGQQGERLQNEASRISQSVFEGVEPIQPQIQSE